MKIYRSGNSFRAMFDSGLRHVLLGLVPALGENDSPPRLIPLARVREDNSSSVEPARVLEAVTKAIRDFRASTGLIVSLEAIEYVPNDSPYYEMYYSLAYKLAAEISKSR